MWFVLLKVNETIFTEKNTDSSHIWEDSASFTCYPCIVFPHVQSFIK